MKIRELTCIVCPRGCSLRAELAEDGSVLRVDGYTCRRGLSYAETECTHPRRTVTSTVRTEDGRIVSVKTADTVPRERVFEVMRVIDHTHPKGPVHVGDVLLPDICGTGVALVATADSE